MHKKNVYLILFVLLCGLAVYFYMHNKQEKSAGLLTKFSITDTANVTKMVISHQDNMVKLEKKDHAWILNDHFLARNDAIKTLLGGLMRLRVTSFVASFRMPKVKQDIQQNQLSVWIYTKNKSARHFFVYEDETINSATIMMMADENKAFNVKIPGYNGKIISLFRPDFSFWRNNIVLSVSPADISSIKVKYTDNPNNSYSLLLDDNNMYKIENQDKQIPAEKTNSEKIGKYLTYFQKIPAERFMSTAEISASDTAKPVGTLQITTLSGNSETFRLFLKPTEMANKHDLNQAYLMHENTGELALVKFVVLDLIFKDVAYFLK